MKTALFACAASPLALSALIAANPVMAQDTASRSALESVDDGAIVVTARRREERLLDVPISVSAIGGEDLAKQADGIGHRRPVG